MGGGGRGGWLGVGGGSIHSLCKGIRGCAAGLSYVFASSGIYYGHKFKILSIAFGYHLPVVCICYGHKMRTNGMFWSEF